MLKKIPLCLIVLSMLSGCANFGTTTLDNESQINQVAEDKARKKRVLLTIGGIVLAGAIIAHEAQDGTQDALRDAVRP